MANLTLQEILLVILALILSGLILLGFYLVLRLAWRKRIVTGLIVLGLFPGLLLGYLLGQRSGSLDVTNLAATDRPKNDDQRVVIPLKELEDDSSNSAPELVATEDQAPLESAGPELAEETQPATIIEEDRSVIEPIPEEENEPVFPENSDDPGQSIGSAEDDKPLAQTETPSKTIVDDFPRPRPKPIGPPTQPSTSEPTIKDFQSDEDQYVPIDPADPRMKAAQDHMELGALIVKDHPGGAITSYAKALELYRQMEAYPEVARALLDLGYAHVLKGEFEQSQNYSLAALEVSDQIGDDFVKVRALINLGFVNMNKREPGNALIYYNQALELAEGYGNSESLATLLENIGYAYAATNQPDKARDYLTRAISVANAVGAEKTAGRVAENLENF